jgi:hypothetical protein
MNFMTEAIRYRGSPYPFILLWDLNVNLNRLENIRADTIAAYLALYGFQDVEIISNTRVVNGHGPNSVKKGAIFKVGLIMLLLKTYLIFDVGLLRFLVLTQIIVQSRPKLPLANYIFIATM